MTPIAHVIFLLDDSSSMKCREKQTKQAFDGFIENLQKCKGAEIRVTLVKYGSECEVVYSKVHIHEVKPLVYHPPSGDDMIFDALMQGISLADKDKDSSKKIIIMLCDGGDTGVSKTMPDEVRRNILAARDKGYEFVFLAAGDVAGLAWKFHPDHSRFNFPLDSQSQHGYPSPAGIAAWLGIPKENIIQYAAHADSRKQDNEAAKAFIASAWNVGNFASGRTQTAAFSESQKAGVKS